MIVPFLNYWFLMFYLVNFNFNYHQYLYWTYQNLNSIFYLNHSNLKDYHQKNFPIF